MNKEKQNEGREKIAIDSENNVGAKVLKIYDDKVWGDINLSTLAAAIINTPEFQRLDRIKQLGFSYYVFRDAKHTRYEHMVGVYGVTKRILNGIWENHMRFEIKLPYENKKKFDLIVEIVAIAALLHDSTHVPFGHTLEDEFKGLYLKHDDLKNTRLWHLLYDKNSGISKIFSRTDIKYFDFISNNDLRDLIFLILKYDCKVDEPGKISINFEQLINKALKELDNPKTNEITNNSSFNRDVAKNMLKKLKEISTKKKMKELFEPYMSDIISDTICADIIDYIARDGRATIGYTHYPPIEKHFIIERDSITRERHLVMKLFTDEELKLGIETTLVELMRKRYAMAEDVYYNNTKMVADVMLGKLLSIVGPPPDINPYSFMKSKKSLDNWVEKPSYHWEELGNSILVMGDDDLLEYCHRKVKKLAYEGKNTKAKVGNQLLEMFRSRNLFKPCVIIPYYLAEQKKFTAVDGGKTESLYEKIYYTFREQRPRKNIDEEIEHNLNEIFKDDKIHVLVFCPPRKRKAKEMETFVEICKGEIRPLHILVDSKHPHLPEPRRDDIENLNKMYNELWKFFVLLHPDDYDKEVIRHAVTLKFWMILKDLGFSILDETIKTCAYPLNTELPYEIIENWLEKNQNYCHPFNDKIIYDKMDSLASSVGRLSDWDRWIEKVIDMRNEVSSIDDLCVLLFEKELNEYYNKNVEGMKIIDTKPGEIWSSIVEMRNEDPTLLVEVAARDKDVMEGGGGPPYYQELRRSKLFIS